MTAYFIDTNIFMYAIGQDHPFKDPSQKIITAIIEKKLSAMINAEVLQEILYRYSAIGKIKIGFELFDTIIKTFPTIWPIAREDLIDARRLQEKYKVKTRDAIHAATMRRNGVSCLYTYDSDFDRIPGIRRLVPEG